jgi:hypothetical protein
MRIILRPVVDVFGFVLAILKLLQSGLPTLPQPRESVMRFSIVFRLMAYFG